jgi:hypothetical protein
MRDDRLPIFSDGWLDGRITGKRKKKKEKEMFISDAVGKQGQIHTYKQNSVGKWGYPLTMSTMHTALSPTTSPKSRRKPSTRRRAGSHLPSLQTLESHDAALQSIRSFLKGHTSYDAFPISFRLIVLDTKLNVKKALQCLLLNGQYHHHHVLTRH